MATKKPEKPVEGKVKVRVLTKCHLGQADDVVEIEHADVATLAGTVDADPAAVAYAESLK